MFYFGNWVSKFLTMGFYPMILLSLSFPFMNFYDSSFENYCGFLKVAFFQSLNAVALGHMWSVVFDDEINSIVSGLALMEGFIVGSGHLLSRQSPNIVVTILQNISPMAYT